MADTGYEQNGTINELTYNAGTDIDGDAISVADTAELTSDAVSLSKVVTRVYSVIMVEDNTGACAGDVYISVLASDLDPDGEAWQVGPSDGGAVNDPCWTMAVDVDQNETRKITFAVDASQLPLHKIHVRNSIGQTIDLWINYIDMDVPVAS